MWRGSKPITMRTLIQLLILTFLSGTTFAQRAIKVTDINPSGYAIPSSIYVMNDRLHFTVNAGASGVSGLWSVDASKTLRLIATDIAFYSLLTVAGDKLFFRGFARPGDINNIEPWVSDGTQAGTRQLKDIFPGKNGSGQGQLFPYKNQIVFAADDGVHGIEPWISDGTTAGTRLLKNISAGASSNPSSFLIFNELLYFWVNNDDGSYDLYRTDGTEEHTEAVVTGVKDVSPLTSFVYKNTIYFLADEGELHYVDFQTNSIAETGRGVNPTAVFPNPVDNHVMLSYELKKNSPVTIRLSNLEGKFVTEALFSGIQSVGKHKLRVELPPGLSAGVYFLNILTKSGNEAVKLEVR